MYPGVVSSQPMFSCRTNQLWQAIRNLEAHDDREIASACRHGIGDAGWITSPWSAEWNANPRWASQMEQDMFSAMIMEVV